MALAQVNECYASENVVTEICQIKYCLYRAREITKKVYNNIVNSIKL